MDNTGIRTQEPEGLFGGLVAAKESVVGTMAEVIDGLALGKGMRERRDMVGFLSEEA